MISSAVELVRRTIQPLRGQAWHGGPTPVGALRGVSAAEARWSPPSGRQSIWRLTLHIAYWKYAVRRHLEGGDIPRFRRSPANFPALPATPDERAWKADRDLLADEHRQLVAAMARLDPLVLDRRPPGAKRWTWGEMVIGVLVHDAYHTGQIQLLKRLVRGRRG
jgi:uncharacterized damage-inducible protein DinB